MLTLVGLLLATPPRLSNAHLRCEFGPRGLVALTDIAQHAVYRLTQDEFRFTIDGTTYDSRRLPEPTSTISTTSITYRWTAGRYRVDVVYELRAGWGFVSKQLFVTGGRAGGYHVDDVTVLDAALADTVHDAYVPRSQHTSLGTADYGGTLRFAGSRGLLAVVQNPFLQFRRDGNAFTIRYQPDMDWRAEYGPFASDRGLLAPVRLSGPHVPARMLPEWRLGPPDTTPGLDEAEVEAFTEMVRAFLIHPPAHPLNIFVGWTANDYQIDVATPAGRDEYKRLLDRAAGLGAGYVLFAPSNSALSRREASVDDWSWEHVLWLGLGQQIRKGEWDPATGAIPPSVQALLDYAKAKHLKLVAYVYPVLPFAGNPAWLVRARGDSTRMFASLGVRALQDWLIDKLVAFYRRTGIGGYAFDHTFLSYDGTSRYAQWWGWRRVMEELKRRVPEIVIDGRQAYQNYGSWSWLAGSYPHPTSTDEQPESFVPFPDLSFDRVSADRERYTAYRYRLYEFAPSEIVPGFIGHQTSRADDSGDMPSARTPDRGVVLTRFRARDWDYLGWRYSLISSIAVAGWNNVINMIPARDSSENAHFSSVDQAWFRHWIAWADTNRQYLRHTRPILGQPAIGKLDGAAAVVDGRGYVFLFNPNERRLTARLTREELGLGAGRVSLHELEEGSGARDWGSGETISIAVEGESYRVLAIGPAERRVVAARGTPAVESFHRQIGQVDSGFTGGTFSATFTVPRWVFDQLAARGRAWPIPWTAADSLAPWLVPERLLLFVQLAEPDERWAVSMKIDGRPVELRQAYSSIRRVPRDFVGFWADISALSADQPHTLEVELPGLKQGQFQGVFLENVEGANRVGPPLVDHHQHLFSPAVVDLVTPNPLPPGGTPIEPIDADKLIALLDSAGIRRALVLSLGYTWGNPSRNVVNEYEKVKAENDWTAEQVARYPDRLRAFCSFNPLRDYALEELARCAGNPWLRTGLKLHIANSAVDYHNPQHLDRLRQVFRAANERRMPILIHMRASLSKHIAYGRDEARIFLDSVLPAAPDIPVQIAHLAGAGGYDSTNDQALSVFTDAIARHDPRTERLWFDVTTSARGATDEDAKLIAWRIRQIGVRRVLFGSDAATGGNLAPREAWAEFLKLPLTEAEFRVIAGNVAPYMQSRRGP